jgi:hypothetical protein
MVGLASVRDVDLLNIRSNSQCDWLGWLLKCLRSIPTRYGRAPVLRKDQIVPASSDTAVAIRTAAPEPRKLGLLKQIERRPQNEISIVQHPTRWATGLRRPGAVRQSCHSRLLPRRQPKDPASAHLTK